MAVTAFWFGNAFISMANKLLDVDSDTWKTALQTSTFTPNQDTHDFYNDVTNEVSSTNYTAGGVAISPLTSTYTGATNVWNVDGADATWTTVSFTMRNAVVYDTTPGTSATDPLLMYVDAGADQTVSSANFSIVWDSAGIAKVTVS